MATRAEAAMVVRFGDRYRLCCTPPMAAVERDALGTDYGSTGYTTRAQADDLARRLHLGDGDRVADIGAGSGWPGLYLSTITGCSVVGTDLPLDGLRRAHARAAADGLIGRAAYAVATGHRQPLRPESFDVVIHTDVLCCLTPKLSVLRACRGLLRPGGRLAFTTIFVTAGLDPRQGRAAHRAGPTHVGSRRPYPELVAQAGFVDTTEIDLTAEYERTQRSWFEAAEQRADELRCLTSDAEFADAQATRRLTLDAIAAGLLRRSLFVTSRPDGERGPRAFASAGGPRAARLVVNFGVMADKLEISRDIAVPPEAVYAAISDVTRMGEWSEECYACEWHEGVDGPAVGATFDGHNRNGDHQWTTQGKVIEAEPGRAFAFECSMYDFHYSTWGYRIEPTPTGSRVTEWSEDLRPESALEVSKQLSGVDDRVARNRQTISGTLERLAATLEG